MYFEKKVWHLPDFEARQMDNVKTVFRTFAPDQKTSAKHNNLLIYATEDLLDPEVQNHVLVFKWIEVAITNSMYGATFVDY